MMSPEAKTQEAGDALSDQVGGDHYKRLKIQPVKFCEQHGLSFCQGNVVKYVTRHRFKNGGQDLEKARHYVRILLDLWFQEGLTIISPLSGPSHAQIVEFCTANELDPPERLVLLLVCEFEHSVELEAALAILDKMIAEYAPAPAARCNRCDYLSASLVVALERLEDVRGRMLNHLTADLRSGLSITIDRLRSDVSAHNAK